MNPIGNRQGPIVDAILSVKPDVVVLTEYAAKDDSQDNEFRERFKSRGYDVDASNEDRYYETRGERLYEVQQNRVLIAARVENGLSAGASPSRDGVFCADSNYLHVSLSSIGVELIGLRVPYYGKECCDQKACMQVAYGRWLTHNLQSFAEARSVVIGDFNFDPYSSNHGHKWIRELYTKDLGASVLSSDANAGWYLCSPPVSDGPSQYHGYRIDHALVSRTMPKPVRATYISDDLNGHVFCKFKGKPCTGKPISDHAALVVEFDL